jgi:hypothetical protein
MSAQKAPTWKIPNAERFNEYTKINEYRGTAPLNYRRNLNELTADKMGSFPKANRFLRTRNEQEREKSPGPGEYETQVFKSIDSSVR